MRLGCPWPTVVNALSFTIKVSVMTDSGFLAALLIFSPRSASPFSASMAAMQSPCVVRCVSFVISIVFSCVARMLGWPRAAKLSSRSIGVCFGVAGFKGNASASL